MEVESAKEVMEEESNAKQISKGDVIVAVVAGTTKYPRRERVKTKRTDSRIGLSCKEYNKRFAKDYDSWVRKQVMKERENERLTMEQEKRAQEKKQEAKKKRRRTDAKRTGAVQQQNKEKEEEVDSSEEDDEDDDDDEEAGDHPVYLTHSLQPAAILEEKGEEEEGSKNNKRKFGLKDKVKFKGVMRSESGRFGAQIRIGSKVKKLGTFDTAKQAAKAFDRAAIQTGRPTSKLNFPNQVPKNYKPKKTKLQINNRTGFRGVCKNKKNRFQAQLKMNGKFQYLGTFDTAKEAAIAWDLAAIQGNRPTSELNFCNMIQEETQEKKDSTTEQVLEKVTKEKVTEKSSKKTAGGKVLREFPKIRTVGKSFHEVPKRKKRKMVRSENNKKNGELRNTTSSSFLSAVYSLEEMERS